MVRVLSITSLALAAISAVSGLVVPRLSPPKGWESDILEPYARYHKRYLALNCQDKHGQPFFDQCCHPLLATQKLESLPSQCIPDDCDDGDDTPTQPTKVSTTPTPKVSPQQKDSLEQPKPSTPTPKPSPKPNDSPEQPKESTSTSSTPKPSPTPDPVSHDPDVNTGGQATFFLQNGVAGACGTVHSDSDFICAMDERRYGNPGAKSALCGKQVKITNTKNGKTVTVTVADDCPTCKNSNSIDLSKAAFEAIAPLSDGIAPIEWSFI